MNILGIDQSLAKCAFVCLEDGVVLDKFVVRTGSILTKKKKGVDYFKTLEDQIHHICLCMEDIVKGFAPDHIQFESLSFGSVGSASRDLAQLYGAMRETLINIGYGDNVTALPPTSLKTFARQFLSKEKQFEGLTKAGKPKLCKMDKKLMCEAVENIFGKNYLDCYNFSNGKDDIADATLLAYHKYKELND